MVNTSHTYLEPLPPGTTLRVYNGADLIFSSSGKWLMPLFELEKFFASYTGAKDNLCAHDTAIGKAAAVLMIRMGIRHIYANLASGLAKEYIDSLNRGRDSAGRISFKWDNMVERLLCATEDQLAPLSDIDEMYVLLRQRSKLIQGIEVKIENLSCRFGSIQNLSVTAPAGGHLMIVGENGTGKTTLLRLIAGIYTTESGRILIDGKPLAGLPKYTIGYIPQQTDNSEFSLSVEEVVGIGVPPRAKNKTQIIQNALRRTSCTHLAGRSFASLSGGEKQKVSLARCLAQNARLLLLDEPTAALDTENRRMVMDILRSLTITEIPTIIVVTHDKELAAMHGWTVLNLGQKNDAAAETVSGNGGN